MNVCKCGISLPKAPRAALAPCPPGEDPSPEAGTSSGGVSKGGQCMGTLGRCEGSSGMCGGFCPGLVDLLGMISSRDCCVVCLGILSLTSASSRGITGADPQGFPVPQPLKQHLPQVRLYLHTCPVADTGGAQTFPQNSHRMNPCELPLLWPNPIVDPKPCPWIWATAGTWEGPSSTQPHPTWGNSGLASSRRACSVLRAGKGVQVSMEKPGGSRGVAPGSTGR